MIFARFALYLSFYLPTKGRGIPSSVKPSTSHRGRGRGNFIPDPTATENAWGSNSSDGGKSGPYDSSSGGRGVDRQTNCWQASRGRESLGRNLTVGRGMASEGTAQRPGNNFWSSMGRGTDMFNE